MKTGCAVRGGQEPVFLDNINIGCIYPNFVIYYTQKNLKEETPMNINTNALVAMTEANQNFSKVVRVVDEEGVAVILKNNKPRYVVVDFAEYDAIQEMMELRRKMVDAAADALLEENMEAFLELAK